MTNTPNPKANTLDEIFDKLNSSSSHACYCQRSTDGGCQCSLKDEYLIEAKQQIEALITAATVDGANNLWDYISSAPKDSWYGTASEYLEQLKEK